MRKRSSNRFRLAAMLLIFFACAFLLPASRTGDGRLYLLAAAVPTVMLILLFLPGGTMFLDRPSLCAALILCGFSILAPAATLPDEALSQGMRCVAALFFLMAGTVLIRAFRPSFPAASLVALLALGLLSVPLWLPSLSFSLTEGGMALLLIAVAAFLSLHLCLPALLSSLGGLMLLLLQQDPAAAALWCVVSVLVFWAVSGSAGFLWRAVCGMPARRSTPHTAFRFFRIFPAFPAGGNASPPAGCSSGILRGVRFPVFAAGRSFRSPVPAVRIAVVCTVFAARRFVGVTCTEVLPRSCCPRDSAGFRPSRHSFPYRGYELAAS